MTMTRPQRSKLPTATEARKKLLAKVHVLKTQRRLDDDTYRDLLEQVTGHRSAKLCGERDLVSVCARLEAKAPASLAVGPFHLKIKALWISGWNLGIVANPSDEAMLAFVTRQTGIQALQWLRDPADARRAIEGLKAWIARAGAVKWDDWPDNPRRAVVASQWRQLRALGAVYSVRPGENMDDALANYIRKVTGGKTAEQWLGEEDWDAVIKALGAKLRAEKKKAESKKAASREVAKSPTAAADLPTSRLADLETVS
jgi:phage gp16-like protein